MAKGRKPKPTHLKAVGGTLRKDRINPNEPKPPVSENLPPPEFLDKMAADEWKRVVPLLEGMKVLSSADLTALAGYCANFSRWVKAEMSLRQHGLTYETETESGGVMVRKNPMLEISRHAQRQMLAFASEFGLTPASRSRLSVNAPVEPSKDRWDGF